MFIRNCEQPKAAWSARCNHISIWAIWA